MKNRAVCNLFMFPSYIHGPCRAPTLIYELPTLLGSISFIKSCSYKKFTLHTLWPLDNNFSHLFYSEQYSLSFLHLLRSIFSTFHTFPLISGPYFLHMLTNILTFQITAMTSQQEITPPTICILQDHSIHHLQHILDSISSPPRSIPAVSTPSSPPPRQLPATSNLPRHQPASPSFPKWSASSPFAPLSRN